MQSLLTPRSGSHAQCFARSSRRRLGAALLAGSMVVGGLLGPTSPALAAPIPTPPGSVTLTGAPGSLVLTWTASLADAASPVTGYTMSFGQVGTATVVNRSVDASTTRFRLDHLPSGTVWVAQVCAVNAVGSDCSDVTGSATVLEPVVPQAPRALTTSLPDGLKLYPWVSKFSVSWQPPAFDGGMPLVGYVISVNGAQSSQLANLTSYTVVTNPKQSCYTVKVAAQTKVGTGPYAAVSKCFAI